MYHIVYKTLNNINGKIYIGYHHTNDLNDSYLGSGKHLALAVDKYGKTNFTKTILHVFDNENDAKLKELEIVNEKFVLDSNTYNLIIGGTGGSLKDVNIAKAISKLGNITKNEKLKTDENFRNKYRTNISRGLKIYYSNHDNGFKFKKHSSNTKKHIGERNSIHQTGTGNSQYGTIWICNKLLKETRKIKKEDLKNWLTKDWINGRIL